MSLNRRLHRRIIVLLYGHVVAVMALSGLQNEIDADLDCFNDFDEVISCQLEQQHCSEYSLTFLSNRFPDKKNCTLQQCDIGSCCCSVKMLLTPGESHTVTVWKGGRSMESKVFDVKESMKPKTPTITSVKESNGIFEIKWETTMTGIAKDSLTAEVMYYKKEDKKKVPIEQVPVPGVSSYRILSERLESSTTYVVSVRSFTNWSSRVSDNSGEREFTTSASFDSLLLAIIIIVSIVVVILSGVIYGCYLKLKTKWWDIVSKHPNPKLLMMHPSEQECFKPVPAVISPICVENFTSDDSKPWSKTSQTDTSSGSLQQSSGISTGSSCLSYANTEPPNNIFSVQDALSKVFPQISPISPLTASPLTESKKDSCLLAATQNPCGDRADGMSSGSSNFVNQTYAILMVGCPGQSKADGSEVQMQAEMPCDSEYHPSGSDMTDCHHQQPLVCLGPAQQDVILPPVVSPFMPTDMSYQQCNADSGKFSESSSLSSISSDDNKATPCDLVSRGETGGESSYEVVSGAPNLNGKSQEDIICDENPCYSCAPVGSQSLLLVDNDYQAFQSLVGQPVALLSEQRSAEREEHLDRDQEGSPTKLPQSLLNPLLPGFINHAQTVQTTFIPPFSADQSTSIFIDSDYQSV